MLEKTLKRSRRHARVRARISGTAVRPRLAVFRSATHIYAQLIDDDAGRTLCAMSDIKSTDTQATKVVRAAEVGRELARRAKDLKIETCVFDRGGNLYAGRVKALADGAREGGLQF